MARFIITGEYKDKATKLAKRDLQSLSRSTIDYGKVAKKYWGIATAAVSYYVQKGLRASANAALDDEKSQRQLAFTLEKVAGANNAATISAEANISAMSQQYGIADDQLRPALAQLVRQTGNLTDAYSALNLALSLSVASGDSLDKAVNAVGRAYMGNYKALKSMGFAVDDNLAKQKNTIAILGKLRKQYGDFAKNELNSTENKYKQIKVAAGEAAETIGVALINAINTFTASQGGVGGVSKTFEKLARDTADLIDGIAGLAAQTKITGKGTKQSWLLAIPILGVYLDQIRRTQAETRKLQTIEKIRRGEIKSLRYEEELAKKKLLQDDNASLDINKKTIDQLIAEEAARKAGFKITEDLDSIQTVAAAKRLEEARQYKLSLIDAAQSGYDALKNTYDKLQMTLQAQIANFNVLKALMEMGITIPVALKMMGSLAGTQAGQYVSPTTPLNYVAPDLPTRNQITGQAPVNVTVNAGAVGSEQYLADLIVRSITQANKNGFSTIPAGALP